MKVSIIVGFDTEYMKTYESDVTIYKKKVSSSFFY